MAGGVQVRGVFDEPEPGDGRRVLVDRIWPRGLTEAQAALDEWCTNVAPSDELSAWYGHDPARFAEFGRRYQVELKDPRRAEALAHLRELATQKRLTLLTATRRADISAAAVLAGLLWDRRGSGQSTVPAAVAGQRVEPGPPVTHDPALAADIVDECGLGSFPASDPPSWWAHAGTG